MIDKINTSKIVEDHIHTLKNYNTNEYNLWDLFIFFAVPFIISIIFIFLHFKLTDGFINVLATSLSIFAALLFNLLLLIYDIIPKKEGLGDNGKLKSEFLKQIYANVSFCIFVAIITIIFLIVSSLVVNQFDPFPLIRYINLKSILALIVYYLLFVFIFTLFMILKRVHILLSKEF